MTYKFSALFSYLLFIAVFLFSPRDFAENAPTTPSTTNTSSANSSAVTSTTKNGDQQQTARCLTENVYADETKKIFEKSQILSIVPKLLDMAQIKDLVPILKEVEVKKDKDIYDYLMLNEIYDQLNEPEKQIHNLEEAVSLSPDDPRPLLLLAKKMMEVGRETEAQKLFYKYLTTTKPHPGRIYLAAYVWAVMYPISVSLGLVFLILFFAILIMKRDNRQFGHLEDVRLNVPEEVKIKFKIPVKIPLFFILIPSILAVRFSQTKQALPFGALLLFAFSALFFVLKPYFEKIYKPIGQFISGVFAFIFNGIFFSRKLEHLPIGWKFLLAFTTLTLFTTILPTIQNHDLKYGSMAMTALVFYSTLGSVLVSFLHTRKSLVSSLRWIAIAATMPFIVSYVVSNWNSLGAPLMYARLPSMHAVDGLFNYLIFWGVSLLLALHLGKIIADALIQPLNEIISKVAQIEKGDLLAKVNILSKDEIGLLALAINRMGDGLAKREKLEKTFKKYVDKEIVSKILDNESVYVQGQQLEAVILFADIRGFTSLSEKVSPQIMVKLLNHFFDKMVPVVKKHGGVVDKFIGDNIMVVWGVPNPIPNAEEKSLLASLEMQEEVKKINSEIEKDFGVKLGIGIGLNTGYVIAGSIGCSEHMEYTVIGDVVNSAQRAESQAKAQQILVTEDFYKKVQHLVQATKLDPIHVKGKEHDQIYWCVSALNQSDKNESTLAG
ncbi:MAG: adenylate/guanylate cyclase domain-containing protein [Pseudobdellovibrionaceae bacterium]